MIPTIENECSEFLAASEGHYIIKNLPIRHQGFAKVKVRLGKSRTDFSKSFNKAFEDTRHGLHESAIFGYTDVSLISETSSLESFYIFPINGFKFIYNPEVEDSSEDYTNIGMSGDFITDLLQLSYRTGSLDEAMKSKCEIIFYGIPYYYALRKSIVSDYMEFFSS